MNGPSVSKSGPVRSFVYFWKDRDRDQSVNIPDHQKTGLDCFRPVFRPVLVLTGFFHILKR